MNGAAGAGEPFDAILLAGGGVQGGQIYGSSDPVGGYPTGKPVLPEDLARTVYHAMGIDDHHLGFKIADLAVNFQQMHFKSVLCRPAGAKMQQT